MLRNKRKQRTPWGAIVGMSTWCLATLVGVWSGLEPDVILTRAVVAGFAVGLAAAILARFLGGLMVDDGRQRRDSG